MCFVFAYCIERKAQLKGTVITWTILFHRILSAKMTKKRIPQSWMIPQYRALKLKLPKYRMKESPIPQYSKPPFPPPYRFLGSFSNDDGDSNQDVEKAIGLLRKTTTLHVHHVFLYISLPSLDDYDVKMPNCKFYGGHKQATTNLFFSL